MRMNETITSHSLIHFSFDGSKPSITLESDWYFIGIIIILIAALIIFKIRKKILLSWYELELEISGSPKLKFKVERNDDNLFIANRIHLELTTRKAAIPIDEENDVIEEIYDSWYKLFNIIREEIKSLPGKYLKNHDPTSALIGLTRKILNEALRPHLTEHQARFRKWITNEKIKDNNLQLSPQQLQKLYPDYENLINSMKAVNKVLENYAKELDRLIKGK